MNLTREQIVGEIAIAFLGRTVTAAAPRAADAVLRLLADDLERVYYERFADLATAVSNDASGETTWRKFGAVDAILDEVERLRSLIPKEPAS